MARKKSEGVAPATLDRAARLKGMAEVAKRFGAFKPAGEVLTRVRAVPTIFPQYDAATRVGGHPIERIALVHGPSNEGKAQPVDTPVLTPTGWVSIGNLQVGDLVVGSTGEPVRVTGVYPQGVKEIFRVETDFGSTRCCDEHLWFTTTENERNRGRYTRGPRPDRLRAKTGELGVGRVRNLAEIRTSLGESHELPRVAPVSYEFAGELPIDPYVLGLLLGDGSFRGNGIQFTANDSELHTAVANEAHRLGCEIRLSDGDRCPTTHVVGHLGRGRGQGRSSMRHAIEALGLGDLHSPTKFVPKAYAMASVDDRRALLAGLLDTDGHAANRGTCAEFSTTSPDLRDAVADLGRGLGMLASVTDSGDSFRVRLFADDCPFRLKRKVDAWSPVRRRVRNRIVAVSPAGNSECVCIAVDAPDRLYVTEDFLLTHNTIFTLGLGLSFLQRDHFFGLVDAEYTTPAAWLRELMAEHADHPGFVAMRPTSFEQTRDEIKRFCERIGEARENQLIEQDTSALLVVDSLRKLVPERIREALEKDAKEHGLDGMSGRAAMYKAALNAQWMDELVPLLFHTKTALVLIAREREKPNAGKYEQQFEVGGGKAPLYESSIAARITRSWVKDSDDGPHVAERHEIRIYKTKVGGRDGRYTDAYFHTALEPSGFDRSRDVFEMALQSGALTKDGGHVYYTADGGESIGKGKARAIRYLREHPEVLEAVEQAARGTYTPPEGDIEPKESKS